MGNSARPPVDEIAVGEILRVAADLIEKFGWVRDGYSLMGAAPRCIRKAIWDAAYQVSDGNDRRYEPAIVALQRISEAIYERRSVVGGINDYEYRKTTTKETVIAVLDKAIELGPATPLPTPEGAL